MLLKTRVPFRCFCSKLALARLQLGGCNRLAVLEKPRRSVPLEGRRPLQKGRGGQARSNNAISRQISSKLRMLCFNQNRAKCLSRYPFLIRGLAETAAR